MIKSCLRCGRCCTRFGVCVTPFDVLRICKATGMEPVEFLDLIPDFKGREREEPAILIGHESCLLVLKRQIGDVCFFYNGKGCDIYGNRPMLCRSYPFRVPSFQSSVQFKQSLNGPLKSERFQLVLAEMQSRSCISRWIPDEKGKADYLADCLQYKKEVEAYKKIAEKWNNEGGCFSEFLEFALQNTF